jgi:3'-phosphoadenosine 5'-phosphosulfate sulfotransferase (PAPS reductase)/FAD synthetase
MIQNLDFFQPARSRFDISIDDRIATAIDGGADVEFNLSGGKDSGAAAHAVSLWLDSIGHSRDCRRAIHADLGRTEWRSTPAQVQRTADFLGVELTVVRRGAGDLLARWQQRFNNAKLRYADMRLYHMLGPWSSPSLKFCQSEMKAQQMGPVVARAHRGRTVIQVVGIRRDESNNRKNAPISEEDTRYAKAGNRHGTRVILWNPICDWSAEEVFAFHEAEGIPLSEVYTLWQLSRHSCAFCIMQNWSDQEKAARAPDNHPLLLAQVGMEAESAYSFQAGKWLADVAPDLLTDELRSGVDLAKEWAAERKLIEGRMPARHRYVDGWPLHQPDAAEARDIAVARCRILDWYGIDSPYRDGPSIEARFAELLIEAASRKAAKEMRGRAA